MTPDFSIVVCTYNRASSLPHTLGSLDRLDRAGLTAEVIVVDNNSRDGTAEIVGAWIAATPLPARYVREPRQGLSNARNAGLDHARGRIIAFTDDDVVVDPRWLQELKRAFADPAVMAAGGRIRPLWLAPRPRWLGPDLFSFLALLDHGDAPVRMKEPVLYGANLAARAECFAGRRFDSRLGRNGDRLEGGEDVVFVEDLMRAGHAVLYWPGAVVHHRIPPERLRRSYFRRWHRHLGRAQARLMERHIPRAVAGVPYHVFKSVAAEAGRWLAKASLRRPDSFRHELNLWRLAALAGMRVRCRVAALRGAA